jgi:arylsulfatase A-like enzyme
MAAVVIAALAVGCSSGPEAEPPRILLIGIDGATWDIIDPLREQGRLPNLDRLVSGGVRGILVADEGELSPAIWTTIATGKPSAEHGIGGFFVTNAAGQPERMVTSADRRVSAIWEIMARRGRRPAVIGWWASWPAEDVGNGLVVTDHVSYSRTRAGERTGRFYATERFNTHPAELAQEIADLVLHPGEITVEQIQSFMEVSGDEAEGIRSRSYRGDFFAGADPIAEFTFTHQSDASYAAIAERLVASRDPELTAVYLQGVDVIQHSFWRAHAGLADDEQQRRYGRTVTSYYEYTDRLIGRLLAAVDTEDHIVIVLSDHGFGTVESTKPGHRGEAVGWHLPEGVFAMAGPGIRIGEDLGVIAPADITPTLLALMGLPIGRDMPGRVLSDALTPAADGDLQLSFLPSHDDGRPQPSPPPDSIIDGDVEQRLRGLGYLE